MSKTKAYNIDCMEYMATLPDKAFELAIVDPPYMDTFKITAKGSMARVNQYNLDSLNNNAPDEDYFKELLRVSKNQIIWGVNYYNYYLGAGRIVWNKDNTGLYSDCELAYHSFSNVTRMFTWRWNGMLQQNMKNKEKRIHPTQKPVALYEWLLMNYAKEGDKILDTHLGSGSSRIAAHKLGFEFVGCELDKDYFEAQEKRFKLETMQLRLF
mgnify:CR=1 FL=1